MDSDGRDLPDELREPDGLSGPDLADRYGTHRSPLVRAVALVGAVAAGVAGAGWLVWAIVLTGDPSVSSTLTGFSVTSAHEATARVTVVRDGADVQASCLVRATASDHAVVGEQRFVVGPGRRTHAALEVAVRTERLATSVELLGCTAPGQPRPR